MGRIGKVLSFTRTSRHDTKISDVQVNLGGNEIVTAEHFATPGDDSVPIPGDFVILAKQNGTGRWVVDGYIDPKNGQDANGGDKRNYSRDSSGDYTAQLWLKNDGEAMLTNVIGSLIKLKTDGLINISNSSESLEDLINDLITAIKNITTFGSPVSHQLTSASKAEFTALALRFLNLFGGV